MESITVAELRQNPTAALAAVEAGETYVVTRHRRPIARLAPVDSGATTVVPPRNPGPSDLASRPQRHTYEDTEALLAEMASDW